jgi:hypothetical protein
VALWTVKLTAKLVQAFDAEVKLEAPDSGAALLKAKELVAQEDPRVEILELKDPEVRDVKVVAVETRTPRPRRKPQ